MWQWAARNVFLSADVTAEPGYYNPERIPYQKRLQEWMTDPRVNDIVACTAAQLIKTTAINNGVGFFVSADPSSILVVYPTKDDAKDWMNDKFMPMVSSSPSLRRVIPDGAIRKTGQTTLLKHFPGGRLKAVGANNPATLRGRSFRVVIQDDLDGFGMTKEGDPSDLADRRAANQPRALRIKFSTPTVKGASRIWKWLEQSSFDELLCPCPRCDHAQVLAWEQVVWESGAPETARYKCVKCGELLDDRERYNMVLEGCRRDLWRSRNPGSRIKGLHMNGLYRLMGEKNSMAGFMEEWVRDYELAKANGEKSLQTWVNLFKAECYEPANSTIEPAPLWKRRERYFPLECLPEEVLVLMAAVDVQGNRLECEVRGIGLGRESWGIEYREFPGDPTEQRVWKMLDAFLGSTYRHPIRGKLRIAMCFIDAGGNKQSETYQFTETRNGRGIYACKGAKGLDAPSLSPLKKSGYNQVPFYAVGTQAIKDTLHSRLLLKAPGPGERQPGFMHWPISDDYDHDYFKKLTAEKKIVQTKGENRGKLMWIAPEGARNEPWDINVYLEAACEANDLSNKTLLRIWRDNERIKRERTVLPPPPPQVTNLDALKAPAAPVQIVFHTPATPLQPAGSAPPAPPVVAPVPVPPPVVAEDPNAARAAPISEPIPILPKKKVPWRVVGRGRSNRDFGAWGA